MNALSVGSKLAKLVALLGTDNEGERLATVEAISRILVSDGLDFHDLARAVEGVQVHARAPAEALRIEQPCRWDGLSHFDRVAWLQTLRAQDWLTPKERGFIADTETAVRCAHRGLAGYEARKVNRLLAMAVAKGVRP